MGIENCPIPYSVEVLEELPARKVRAENRHYCFIATFDTYFKETIVDLIVIVIGTGSVTAPMPQHYYDLGLIMGWYYSTLGPQKG